MADTHVVRPIGTRERTVRELIREAMRSDRTMIAAIELAVALRCQASNPEPALVGTGPPHLAPEALSKRELHAAFRVVRIQGMRATLADHPPAICRICPGIGIAFDWTRSTLPSPSVIERFGG